MPRYDDSVERSYDLARLKIAEVSYNVKFFFTQFHQVLNRVQLIVEKKSSSSAEQSPTYCGVQT